MAKRPAALHPEQAQQKAEEAQAAAERMRNLLDQVELRHAQLITARDAFYRLAQVRAADRVRHEGLSWGDGAAYINAEMQALDAQLAAVVTQENGQ